MGVLSIFKQTLVNPDVEGLGREIAVGAGCKAAAVLYCEIERAAVGFELNIANTVFVKPVGDFGFLAAITDPDRVIFSVLHVR